MRSPWSPRPHPRPEPAGPVDPAGPAGPRRRRPSAQAVLRLLVRTFSEACLTVGTVIVLFVGYVLLWTGVKADRAMDGEMDRLHDRWSASAAPAAATPRDPAPVPAPERGRAFAEMYIPRFGADWNKPVLEGTATDVLKKGLGHYAGTALPGGEGNFSVAGHRRTYGDPFKDFPELRPGDLVIVKDAAAWYTYTIRNEPLRTLPTDVAVVDPVPRKSPFTSPGRYLTLTTCDPEWGHSHRLIVWAELTRTRAAEQGKPEGLAG
ncbi:class E sortase [Streptomyces sp. PvR034]|uniref:class E sortase n=1 Tax=Streptomyces sp. PvR034 TaxID=3156401 RepID=UPI003397158E